MFRKRQPGNIANILVVSFGHVSDAIFSTVVAQNLKEHYKGAKITFLVLNLSRDIVIDNPYIDEVICYDAPWLERKGKRVFEFKRFFKLAGEIKKHNYDLGIDLKGDFRHRVLMAIGKVKFRVGYGKRRGSFLLSRKITRKEGMHPIESGLNILRHMSVNISTRKPAIYTSKENKASASDILKQNSIEENDPIAVVHTIAGSGSKNWLDFKFAELIGVVSKEYNFKVVVVGSEGDKRKNDSIISASGINAINLSGKTSLPVLAEIIRRASLFIGVDSCPGHMAALEDVPSVMLCSGIKDSDEWSGIGLRVIRIKKDISCKGCGILDCRHNICMDIISVEDVIEAVEKVKTQVEA